MQKISTCEREFSEILIFEIFTFKNSLFIEHIKSKKNKNARRLIYIFRSYLTYKFLIYVLLLRKSRSLWESAFFAFSIRVDVENNQIKTSENNYAKSFLDHWLTSLEKIHLKNIKNNAWLYRIIVINESSLLYFLSLLISFDVEYS